MTKLIILNYMNIQKYVIKLITGDDKNEKNNMVNCI